MRKNNLLWLGITNRKKSCHVRDMEDDRGTLWVTTSEYVSNQYVKNVGRCKKKCRSSKRFKFAVVVEPLAQLNVIEFKVLHDSMCDFYYDVEMNCKLGSFDETQEYKPPIAR